MGVCFIKRPDQFLPIGWPNFYKKANGCNIWDLDNRKYIDFSLMGVGTNILGYSNKNVNKDLIKIIDKGYIHT